MCIQSPCGLRTYSLPDSSTWRCGGGGNHKDSLCHSGIMGGWEVDWVLITVLVGLAEYSLLC